jgi:hypothetical protein
VATPWVVPAFNPGEYSHAGLRFALEGAALDELAFQAGEEALGHRVVVGIAYRSHSVGDITAPVDDLAGISWPVSHVFIVENLQTGLAMSDMPGAVVFMRLGYNVDVLARLPWLARARCIYWGDLDTHGFAILHRARSYIPELQSVLMDEETLLRHKALWVDEAAQHSAAELTLLTKDEQQLYRDLKQQRWGQNVRLEQERIDWIAAWNVLQRSLA